MKATPPPSSEPNPTTPPAVAPTPPAAPVTPTVPVVPTWPAWFGGADRLILGIVLIAAFLATSYAARNSDLWLHLATGRLVVTGSYPFGSDPFSYTGESRAWADSNWLYGTVLYGVYSANTSGAAAVIVKALAFTAAFVLVNLLRRPGHAVWPWAVFTAIGALAAAPASSLRPQMVSFLFLAITLVLIYRGRWGSGWRMPGILAGLFAVWANCDSWFLLGPLTVLLVLVGERIQRSITKSGSEVSDDTDPFYAHKLTTGRYFLERVLPEAGAHLAKLKAGSATMMELPAEAF